MTDEKRNEAPLTEPFASMQKFITDVTAAAERGEVQLFASPRPAPAGAPAQYIEMRKGPCGCAFHSSEKECDARCVCACNADFVKVERWECRIACGRLLKEDEVTGHDCFDGMVRCEGCGRHVEQTHEYIEERGCAECVIQTLEAEIEQLRACPAAGADAGDDDIEALYSIAADLRNVRNFLVAPSGEWYKDRADALEAIAASRRGIVATPATLRAPNE